MYPFLFETSWLVLPSYYVMTSLGAVAGLLWGVHRADLRGLPRHPLLDLTLLGMAAGLVGARLMHVFYEAPGYYLEHPKKILEFWDGGFVYFGGLLLAAPLVYWVARFRKIQLPALLDVATVPLAFAYAIGRIGCFLNGCCYGSACAWNWAVHYPDGSQAPSHVALHPAPLYATGLEFITILLLLIFEKQAWTKTPGRVFWIWLSLHGMNRVIVEQFRGDDRGAQLFSMSISTWIGIFLVVFGIWGLRSSTKGAQHASNTP